MKRLLSWSGLPSLILFFLFLAINGLLNGGFSSSFFQSFIATNAGAICLAIGVTATIITGGIDISLGSIVSLVNVVIVTLNGRGVPLVQSVLVAFLTALLCGGLNGFLIGVMRVNPLLTTFATSTAFAGIALWILPYPGGTIDLAFNDFYLQPVLGCVPMPILLILIPIAIWAVFQATFLRTHLYAIGQSEYKAYSSGINVTGLKFFVHVFAGSAAGIAGICISANTCAGSPTIGASMSMNSIAAAVIGGVSLNGGLGNIYGSIFGAGFLSILISIVVSANLSSYVQNFIQGLILLIGIVFSVIAGDAELRWKLFGSKGGRRGAKT